MPSLALSNTGGLTMPTNPHGKRMPVLHSLNQYLRVYSYMVYQISTHDRPYLHGAEVKHTKQNAYTNAVDATVI